MDMMLGLRVHSLGSMKGEIDGTEHIKGGQSGGGKTNHPQCQLPYGDENDFRISSLEKTRPVRGFRQWQEWQSGKFGR